MGKKHDLNQNDPALAAAVQALRASRQAAADEVANREAAYLALPDVAANRAALVQAAHDWAASMDLEVTVTKIVTAFGETFVSFTACGGDFAELFHLCFAENGEVNVYLSADPVKYSDGHPASRIECEADVGGALKRAESHKMHMPFRG